MPAGEHVARACKVSAFALFIAAVGAALYLDAAATWSPPLGGLQMPWIVLLAAFVASEVFVVQFEFRGDAQHFTLSELPLVLGLFFATPVELLSAKVLGGLLVIVFLNRQAVLKLVFNAALMVFSTGLALFVFARGVELTFGLAGTHGWPAAFLAGLAVTLGDAVAIGVVVHLSGGQVDASAVRKMLAIGTIGVLGTTSLSLLAVTAAATSPGSALLVAVVAGVVYAAYRGYAEISERYKKLQQLYTFTQILNRSPEFSTAARAILDEARQLLHSERAQLCLDTGDPSGLMCITLTAAGDLDTGVRPPEDNDPVSVLAMTAGESTVVPRGPRDEDLCATLAAHGAKDLIMVPLVQGGAVAGMITVLDRLGDVATFDEEDLTVFATFANHASMSLENTRLIDELRKEAADKRHQALHDSLTGLANRTKLYENTTQALARSTDHTHVAILLMDLDRFKEINDTLGHHHGDLLLKEVAERLKSVTPSQATVARLGGDEFALLVPDAVSEDDALRIGELVSTVFDEPFAVGDVDLTVSGSLGVAMSPKHGTVTEQLMQCADIAMYSAKESSEHRVQLYRPESHESSKRRLALAGALRQTLEDRELQVAFQPKARLATGEVVGVEALARWHHPDFGQVVPDEFIPLAEHVGLIQPLTTLVLEESLTQLARWTEQGIDMGVAVNLSVHSLMDSRLPREMTALLDRFGIDPARLTLEITESEIMRDPDRAMTVLARLYGIGVRLSIDDFGTGHSSLAYLKQLPVHEVKIDKSFILEVATGGVDSTIVRSIVDVARNRGLQVVAEGVEDRVTWEVLGELGCDIAQGYYLARPTPPAELTPWLHEQISRLLRPAAGQATP